MLDFLKKKNKKTEEVQETTNDFLNTEKSLFDTQEKSINNSTSEVPDYQSLIYQPPVYNAPKYKAGNLNNIGVVVDSNAIGFDKNTINPNIKTIEVVEKEDEEDNGITNEIIDNVPIMDSSEQVELVEVIDPIEVKEEKNIKEQPSIFQNLPIQQEVQKEEENPKISIFGSSNGVTDVSSYSTDSQFQEEKKELVKEVEYTNDGYKICPNCGAILNPNAPVCFMCSKSFVLKK